ncbi:hypothetical protein [Frigidibacter sp. ROC022]|uniref:hypothetical protein n=1 Tax=Frigidibacter sp. ROC022 TaxID=2971796 RepID=UPI00215A8593|nr:hypothetical protein [Frigidibacter sp. ROC022]MCR8723397.1 hypothetical protein [Frigidibacter sp. ROC022]
MPGLFFLTRVRKEPADQGRRPGRAGKDLPCSPELAVRARGGFAPLSERDTVNLFARASALTRRDVTAQR